MKDLFKVGRGYCITYKCQCKMAKHGFCSQTQRDYCKSSDRLLKMMTKYNNIYY